MKSEKMSKGFNDCLIEWRNDKMAEDINTLTVQGS
jgi:hypothetical protein